jgi:RNA polymerase sigma factor (sigma-70 family)
MRSGDEAAFEDYVASTQRRWVNTAYRLCNDSEQAQDLVAHAWEKLYLKWPQVHAKGDPHGYMAKMLHNAFIDILRSSRFKRELTSGDLPETPVADSFVDELAARAGLKGAWELLTGHEKVVVNLRVFEGYTLMEIADLLSLSHSTVKRRWESGCVKLRAFYRSHEGSA